MSFVNRIAEFDSYLKPGMYGIEFGVQLGYHAESILNKGVAKLLLVDVWDNESVFKACLENLFEYSGRVFYLKSPAEDVVPEKGGKSLDFIYFDLPQTYELTMMMLKRWKDIPLIGYRGARFPELLRACKEFAPDCIVTDDDIIILK